MHGIKRFATGLAGANQCFHIAEERSEQLGERRIGFRLANHDVRVGTANGLDRLLERQPVLVIKVGTVEICLAIDKPAGIEHLLLRQRRQHPRKVFQRQGGMP
ncbi:MAG: hypothetical protein KF891_00120 [Rhizobacter sp.]|nr:hypothetical protein [Rhizobacter sp.]